MPIRIPNDLPAVRTLEQENIFVMTEKRAMTQDIRPLEILLLNLMPKKIETETQLSRLLGNTPLQIHLELMCMKSHQSLNTAEQHLHAFYRTFDELRDRTYDGMIITGAPVEQMAFEEVDYWPELCEIMEWSKTHVHSTFHICWGAQAGLYYHYGVQKRPLSEKLFGVFRHSAEYRQSILLRGFDDTFYVPHSRHTTVLRSDVEAVPERVYERGQADLYHGTRRVRRGYAPAGISARRCGGQAHRSAEELFSDGRPGPNAHGHVARARQPAVFQLAQLYRLADDAIRHQRHPPRQAHR